MRVRSLPQANCDGDKGTSLVESDWYVRGREFTIFSASFTIVLNFSSVMGVFWILRRLGWLLSFAPTSQSGRPSRGTWASDASTAHSYFVDILEPRDP